MTHPLVYLILLLAGAGGVFLFSRLRPRYAGPTAVITATVVTLLWLPARVRLPLSLSVSPWPASLNLPDWTWRVDEAAWEMSLAVLILVTAVTLFQNRQEQHFHLAGQAVPAGALALLFGLAGLVALWANTLNTLLAGWTLLSFVFAGALLSAQAMEERPAAPGRVWTRLGAAWGGLFFVWLAAATLPPAAGADGLAIQAWPVLARSLLLVAALLQIGVFPLHWWRPAGRTLPPGMAALAHTIPAAAGVLLWARLEASSDIGLGFALPLTLLGLLGLFAAVYRAWSHPDAPQRVAAALVMGQGSVILLAGMWAGPQAVVAEGRVLLLAGGLLVLAAPALKTASPLARLGPLLAALAMAGLPLTAGFRGRGLLYGAWQGEARWILILAAVLLHLPLAAAALMLVVDDVQAHFERSPSLTEIASAAPTLVPVIGLPSVAGLASASIVAWPAVLLPIVAGAALVRYAEEAHQVQQLLRAAMTVEAPAAGEARSLLRAAGRALAQAIRQAVALVEGEGAFLWLLLLLVIVWLAW